MCTSHFRSFPSFHPSTPYFFFLFPCQMYTAAPKKQVGRVALPTFVRRRKRGFGICRDSDRRKERLLSPPISQCNGMRQLPQNSVEFIFFCWKLSSGHLNVRAEGSRKGKRRSAHTFPSLPQPNGEWRRRPPLEGKGRSSRRGRCKKEEEEGRKRFFSASFTCAYDDDSVLVGGERREEERDIFPLLSRFYTISRNFCAKYSVENQVSSLSHHFAHTPPPALVPGWRHNSGG